MMKDTLVIAFNGGAYGTYLEWALNTLTRVDSIEEPFTELGNSHNSRLGYHLGHMDKFLRYIRSDEEYLTGRIHPKTHQYESLGENLNTILDHVDRLILLYPDRSHQLMCICNYITKIWGTENHYYDGAMSYMDPQDILKNYPLDPNTDLRDIPAWIVREHMSFNLFQSWEDQVEWYFPDQWQHDRALTVTTKSLFDDFESTMLGIMEFWDRDCARPVSELRTYHDKMLSIQPHLGKDQTCDAVIRSVLGEQEAWHWGDLCMVSQAWIQHVLRSLGYELQCQDLDEFPTHTEHLRSLIYRV